MRKKVIAIVGPTSSGKSALGIFLAKKFSGEVVSADSRQVYKGLDIGTGKVTESEMQGVPHHLLDVVSPKKQFSVDDFVKKASKVMQKKDLPIVVGGTGFYVDTLLGRMTFPSVPPNPALRARLETKNVEELYNMLKKKDPARAKTIEPKHKRRIIRAIEIAQHQLRQTTRARALQGARPSLTLASSSLAPQSYETLWLGLSPAPAKLKQNIHKRLTARLKQGMVAEAKRLHNPPVGGGLSYKRMEELGLEYRYLARLLQNKISKQEFEAQLEREINKYAKRQHRWFKRNKEIHWISSKTEALRLAKKFLGGR